MLKEGSEQINTVELSINFGIFVDPFGSHNVLSASNDGDYVVSWKMSLEQMEALTCHLLGTNKYKLRAIRQLLMDDKSLVVSEKAKEC